MRRILRVSIVVAVLGLVFGLGVAAEKKKPLKFPWAGEKLNEPCGKTKLEWKCITTQIRPSKPKRLTSHWDLAGFVAEPKKKGLLVTALVIRRPKVKFPPLNWKFSVERAARDILRKVRSEIGGGRRVGDLFEEAQDCQINIYEGSQLIGVRTQAGFELKRKRP